MIYDLVFDATVRMHLQNSQSRTLSLSLPSLTPSLFTLGSKPIFFPSLSHRRLLIPYALIALLGLRPLFGLIMLIGLFYFLIIISF